MSDLHGACVVGVVDLNYHTAIEEADIVTVSRGYGIEVKPLLPPPESLWFLLYDSNGAQILTKNSLGIFLPKVT